MKRVFSSILLLLLIALSYPIVAQERNVIVNTNSVDRTVITTTPTSEGNVDIWAQLEQERLAAEKAEQERRAAEQAEQQRIADSIATAKRLEMQAIKKAHQDSLKIARKERIAAYPWSNFVMVNGAYALYPEYAFGITYARVKQYGFYVSAMMNPSVRFHADHYASANGAIDGEYPFYSGKHTSTRISATAGALVRLHIPMYLYAGVGYGYRGLFYETTEHEWVAWRTANTIYHGMHWEAGLMGNIKGFAISLGVSSITDFSNMYYEAKLGLGYCF
ncbi:MAG: hypothetical protein IKY87_07160 [Paludibacteraceae bacterium]|nr:hypothetical protein [Paludibacteraceae bacterium]